VPSDNPPAMYWNLAGSLYAYLYIQFTRMQIDIVEMSQFVGFPSQFPSVSMMDWTTNKPNARFWALKLIKDAFHPGDKLVETSINSGDVAAQAFITPSGRALLLANKRNKAVRIELPDAPQAIALTVDAESADGPARSTKIANGPSRWSRLQ
jgi:hypothetical protein